MAEVKTYIKNMLNEMYIDQEKRDFYIELATDMTSVSYFGTKKNYAIALRAMHNYIIDRDRPAGEAGLITGKSEGNLSVRYWNKVEKGRYSDLQMTHYGQRLLALMKASGPPIGVAQDANSILANLNIDGE